MENRKEGIWIIDAEAQTIFANEGMAEILGTSPSEMIGQPSFTYVFPSDVQAAQRLFDMKKGGNAAPFHFALRRKDGTAASVTVQGTPIKNKAGVFMGIVGTFRLTE